MQIILNIPQQVYALFLEWVNKYPQIKILKRGNIDTNDRVHQPYIASHAVLAQDWDSPEDDHWDNY